MPRFATRSARASTRRMLLLGLPAIGIALAAGCGDGIEITEVPPDDAQIGETEQPLEVDRSELLDEAEGDAAAPRGAIGSATLDRVPGGADPADGGGFFGSGGQGESFGIAGGGPATAGGIVGSGDSTGSGGEAFGSSNATVDAGDGLSAAGGTLGAAAARAGATGSGLVGSGAGAASGALAGGSRGESFGFRSDGGSSVGASPSGAAAGSAIDTTPGAVTAPPGATPSRGSSFGRRVDQPRAEPPVSFGYAGPPRPEDRVASPSIAAAPSPVAPAAPLAPVVPATPGAPVDQPLPPLSPTLPPAGGPTASASGAGPTPVAARPRLFGCAPARRPDAAPRLRMLSFAESGLRSVAYVCLPAGVRPEFNGWRNGPGVTRITQTADAGDIYELPAGRVRRAGIGLPANVLEANPQLRMVPETVTAFRGFDGRYATTTRLLRRPRATFAEVTPRALARVVPADLDRVSRGAWADIPVRDLRKLPAMRWSQMSRATVAAVPASRRAQLGPAARRVVAGRGL